MRKVHHKRIKGLAISASVLALVSGGAVYAQETEANCAANEELVSGECVVQTPGPDGVDTNVPDAQDAVDAGSTQADGTAGDPGGIVVTGSRIKRDTYTSISPLQVITTQSENDTGVFDPTQILQRSESASGTQIDATFQGFVLNNGPGSETVDLRGLGADRTLLLLNGRRLAPSGVEGAPSSPSINLLPSTLVDRYDLLLDGASSVYGSDAVAGVTNIILRKDFDGLELQARGEVNPYGSGEDYTISGAYGLNFDRGFVGFGAEYDYRDAVRLRDRAFFRGCDTEYEETQDGEIRTVNISDDAFYRSVTGGAIGGRTDSCKQFIGAGAIIVPSIYDSVLFYQPAGGSIGFPGGNSGIPNFSVQSNAFGEYIDANNDGLIDADYFDYNVYDQNETQTFIPEQKRYNLMAYGEYNIPGDLNLTPYFEANYSRAEVRSDNNGAGNVALYVPGSNPFNPCNVTTGTDCGRAQNETLGLYGTPFELAEGVNRAAQPFFSIAGDRDNIQVRQEQYRGVIGMKGDLPFIGSSWTFDVAGVYSRSVGYSRRLGIREDKLAFALGIDPTADFDGDGEFDTTGNLAGGGDGIADDYNGNDSSPPLTGGACNAAGLANPDAAMPDLLQGCVPVNAFADSVFTRPFGSFATQAERDYVFGVKEFNTTYEQLVANAYVTGDVFTLPAGPVSTVIGIELRNDAIDSRPDVVTANGLFIQQNSDLGTVGNKWVHEAFAELDIPLQADKVLVRELNLNVSGRITDEELYGTNFTYAIKAGWRPIDPLLLKFSYGTSFRAPNLRENFLAGQTGFFTVIDPCAVPAQAFDPLAPVGQQYNAAQDDREPNVLAACIREGRDPTRVGIDPSGTSTTNQAGALTLSGGSLDLRPETSRSITTGFAFEETFGDGWDISLGMNYYDIKLVDSIIEPSSQYIVNDCFTRTDGTRSPFCDRITYETDPNNSALLIAGIDSGFLNLDSEAVRGIDLNATFGKEVIMFGRAVDFGLNIRANHLIERSELFINDLGEAETEEYSGEFGFPEWTGRATFTADVDNFRFTWQTRFIDGVRQDEANLDPFSDAFGYGPDGEYTGFFGQTCLGGGSRDEDGVQDGVVQGDGVYCRDIGYAGSYFLNAASVRYETDRYTFLVGVDNIFDVAPPRVDSNEVLAISNTAIGNGYDLDGREIFVSVGYRF